MNKYLCFRPLKIDFIDCTDITSDNIGVINDTGYKRRWNLVAYKFFRGISELNEFISEYLSLETKYLPAVGVDIKCEDINELLNSDTYMDKKVFFVINISEISENNDINVFDNIRNLALKERVFISNDDKKLYHSMISKIRELLGDIHNVMLESDYIAPDSDMRAAYLDMNEADLSKIKDPCKYAISITYSDSIDTLAEADNDKLTDWSVFRQRGIFNMISNLRKRGLSEQEITECTYGKFCDFIGAER